ncbi:hypothetical protein MHUMG1_08599 [Metarhizium humberi]|uniref:Uncharacterized protein n=1 Tax=Metarhizium humberi TaxID=2596975 RepID=A0A9P8S483_9HYPO|nr:hypothetical protein MHUMG1_08599 [Metarhizium humberi]
MILAVTLGTLSPPITAPYFHGGSPSSSRDSPGAAILARKRLPVSARPQPVLQAVGAQPKLALATCPLVSVDMRLEAPDKSIYLVAGGRQSISMLGHRGHPNRQHGRHLDKTFAREGEADCVDWMRLLKDAKQDFCR